MQSVQRRSRPHESGSCEGAGLRRWSPSGPVRPVRGARGEPLGGPAALVTFPDVGLKGFERRLEHAVEGVFSRVFKSGVRPIEIGRRLTREMDDQRTVDVRGRTVAPNSFTVFISPDDHDAFVDIADTLARELCDAAREHARDEGYAFLGPVETEMVIEPVQRTGTFAIEARFREGPGGSGAGSLLLPTGRVTDAGVGLREEDPFVREGGLEPPHPFGHRHLKPARLPIPPLARVSAEG